MFLKDLFSTTERTYTQEGYLVVPSKISRSGVQDYRAVEMGLTDRDPMAVVVVYRPPEEVFSDESMASFHNKPITNDHPPELIDASNSTKFSIGHSTSDIKRDGEFLIAELIITDKEVIKQIESGKIEISNGYECDIEWISGVTPDGVKYDAIQKNIVGNHIAIVSVGRAGPNCKISDTKTTNEGKKMAKVTINDIDYEVEGPVQQAVGVLQRQVRDAEKETEKTKEEMDEMEEKKKKEDEAHKAKLEDALARIPDPKAMDKLVVDHMAFIDAVKTVCPDIKWEGKDSATIKLEVIKELCPDRDFEGKSADFIDATFELVTDRSASGVSTINDALQQSIFSDNADTSNVVSLSETARGNKAFRDSIAWMTTEQQAEKIADRKEAMTAK